MSDVLLLCWCYVQLYSRGHVKLLGTELSDLNVFTHLLKVNDKRFVCNSTFTCTQSIFVYNKQVQLFSGAKLTDRTSRVD